MATTYYMAMLLNTLLWLFRYEVIEQSNQSTNFTPRSPP